MANSEIKIRVASPEDAPALLAIYAPYVEHTAISYEYEVPSPEAFRARIENTLKTYPYLVAEERGEILGYAYAGPFGTRQAYSHSAEVSIYLRADRHGLGLGRRLYEALEEICRAQNITNLCARIARPEIEDEYLTENSMRFHSHMGYRAVGTFEKCAYKFGRWYGMIWMEKIIAPHPDSPAPLVCFPDLELSSLTPGKQIEW